MHGRLPAARDGDEIAGHRDGFAARVADLGALDRARPERPLDDTLDEAGPRLAAEHVEARQGLGARIDHGRHGDAGLLQVAGGPQRIVVVAEQHGAAAGPHGEAVEIGPDRPREHHARPVVVGEDDRALDGARRQHAALGHDPPQALAWLVRWRQRHMVVDPFQRRVGAPVIDTENAGPTQDADLRQARQLRLDRCGEGRTRLAADLALLRDEPAAEDEILGRQDDAGAGPPGGERRHEPRRTAAHHQHVAEGGRLFVKIRIGGAGGTPEPGGAADHRLVDLLPEGGRPHEGLVVEAGAEDGPGERIDRHQVEAQARPAVLAAGHEAVVKLRHGGAGIGLAPRAVAQFDESVGLLRAGRQDAARGGDT